MKKNYLAPEIHIVVMGCETVIANSMKIHNDPNTKISDESSGGWVKGNSGPSNTSVWDDDWSK